MYLYECIPLVCKLPAPSSAFGITRQIWEINSCTFGVVNTSSRRDIGQQVLISNLYCSRGGRKNYVIIKLRKLSLSRTKH